MILSTVNLHLYFYIEPHFFIFSGLNPDILVVSDSFQISGSELVSFSYCLTSFTQVQVQKINSTNAFVSVFLSGLQQAAEGLEILIKTNLVIVYSDLKAQLTQMRTTIRNLQGVNGSISSAQLSSKEKEILVTLLQNLYLIQGDVKS
jgi:hypothetical protein